MRLAGRSLGALCAALALALLAVILGWGPGTTGPDAVRPETLGVALAVAVGLRALVVGRPVASVPPTGLLVGGVVAYGALMSFIVLSRHYALRSHALDLGYYVQVVWNIGAGRGALVTLPPMHAWGDHLSPVLYLFVPLARLLRPQEVLLLGQTLIFTAGAVALFAYARRRLGDPGPAAVLAVLYLVNPSLHGINLRDVHPQTFAIPLLVAAALAFDAGRHGWCALALALTLAGREDAALAVVGFAIWLALARGRRAIGLVLGLACVGLLALDIYVVMPHFRGEPYPHLHRYTHLGSSFADLLVTLLFRPWRWVPVVLTAPKLLYVLALLAPLGFLPLLAPRVLAAALPGLAINLLSLDPRLFNFRTQYQGYVLPFVLLAAVEGYARLREAGAPRPIAGRPRPAVALICAFTLSAVLTSRTLNDLSSRWWGHGPWQRGAYALMARVPPGVPASVNERLVPHLAARAEIYDFPRGVPRAEVVLDLAPTVERYRPEGYEEVGREGEWVLLRKKGT